VITPRPRWARALGRSALAAALALLGDAGAAHASPLFELTGGTLGTGGLSARATGASAASSYFNPALLPRASQGIEFGFVLVNDAISIEGYGKDPANDVPTSAVSRFGSGFPSVPTEWLEQGCDPAQGGDCASTIGAVPRQSQGSSGNVRLYQAIGFVTHVVPRWLSAGLYALVPYGGFTQAHSFYVDEREQFYTNSLHPELYSDRLTPISLAFGAGSRLTDWLSIGLSFTLSLQNKANAVAYVGNSAELQRTLQLSTKVNVEASVSPHLAVVLTPRDGLDISLTLHSPQKMVLATEFGIYLPNGDVQTASRPATHAYVPWIVGAGASQRIGRVGRVGLSAVGALTYERWSQYVNRQSERPLPGYAFHDTVTGTLGMRATLDDDLTFMVDATYHPTPVPRQRGRTNYVDNDRVGLLAGVSYELPFPRFDMALRVGAQTALSLLPRRSQTKRSPTPGVYDRSAVQDEWADDTVDISTGQVIPEAAGLQTNNPGFPGFSSHGLVLAGSLTVGILY
jgi:long-chain fatty acid transport protein